MYIGYCKELAAVDVVAFQYRVSCARCQANKGTSEHPKNIATGPNHISVMCNV